MLQYPFLFFLEMWTDSDLSKYIVEFLYLESHLSQKGCVTEGRLAGTLSSPLTGVFFKGLNETQVAGFG